MKPLMSHRPGDHAPTRGVWPAVTLLVSFAGVLLIRQFQWQAGRELHTVLETIATVLALMAGVIAIMRYYARKTPEYLLLGCAFLGTALFDGFHAVITSSWCKGGTLSPLGAITSWSGLVSRFYLSSVMCSSYLISIRKRSHRARWQINENAVYLLVGCWTFCSFLFLSLFPLPYAYSTHAIVFRPGVMVSGLLFGVAALGFGQKRARVDQDLRYWLLQFLVLSASSDLLYMSFSANLYDLRNCAAHGLKILSYLFVLGGLSNSVFFTYRREAESRRRLEEVYRSLTAEADERERTEEQLLQAQRDLEARVEARTADLEAQGRQLRAAHSEMELFLTSIPSILIGLDAAGHITRWNPTASEVFGIPYPDALGRTFAGCGIRWVHPHIEAEIARWLHSETLLRCDDLAYEKDGETRSLGLTVRPILSLQKEAAGFIITGADITERKITEAALSHLAAIVESAEASILSAKLDGTLLSWNAGAERLYGYSGEEVKGANLLLVVPPDGQEVAVNLWRRVARGESIRHFETVRLTKDGRRVDVLQTLSPIRDAAGQIIAVSSIAADITERKLLERQLVQAQKLESIGQLAAGIAHEINTPIQYVGDNIRFLRDSFTRLELLLAGYDRLLASLRRESPAAQFLTEIDALAKATRVDYLRTEIPKSAADSLDGVERVAQIVRAIKEFSHPGSTEKTPLDINHAIESTVLVSRNEWKYVAELTLDLDPELPPVRCVPGEFNQVILNLIINAAHAIADVVSARPGVKGTITISTHRDGDYAEIRISDTGTGIPEEARPSIFNPFFTTKAVGKGTGQGLSIAHNVIVQKHAGAITFETEIGAGTTFQVRLPIGAGAEDFPPVLEPAAENG